MRTLGRRIDRALSNTIWGLLIDPNALPWWPVALFIGFVAGWCARGGLFKSWWKVAIAGFLVALTAALVSTPIAVYIYGGITASGSSFLTAYLLQTGQGVLPAVLITNILVEPFDKISTSLLAFAIIQGLSTRFLARFPRPENVQTEGGDHPYSDLYCSGHRYRCDRLLYIGDYKAGKSIISLS